MRSETSSNHIEAMLDMVVDYWRNASAQAGVEFDDFKPAYQQPSIPHPDIRFAVWVDLDSEISFGVGVGFNGDYYSLSRSRAEVKTTLRASEAVYAVKDFAIMLGKQFRRATGQPATPPGWDLALPEVVERPGSDNRSTYYLGKDDAESPYIATAWKGVERSRVLTIPTDEFLTALKGSPRGLSGAE